VHLAGANFGSGLAHIGQGQLSRWKNIILQGTGVGNRILTELEFAVWKTRDLHQFFLQLGNDIYQVYQVQEFCIIGSQALSILRSIPIRYVKEASSDNTVRTSAGNLNFNYIPVTPVAKSFKLTVTSLLNLTKKRLDNRLVSDSYYDYDLSYLSKSRQAIPFAIAYDTAHSGKDIRIVSGKNNRRAILPLIKSALTTPYQPKAYEKAAERFNRMTHRIFERVALLSNSLLEWDKQSQYDAHAQLIFRIRDQFDNAVEDFDILRTMEFNKCGKHWRNSLADIAPVNIEISGTESESDEIAYLPLTMSLSNDELMTVIEGFKTTIIDITLLRLPSDEVFKIEKT